MSTTSRSSSSLFDFGFTAVTEEELETTQTAIHQTQTTQDQLDQLFNAIMPLLNNLKQNPEKDYILWPNRLEKVEQFEDLLQNIYQGKST
jgi:hypothetical protein